MFRFKVVLTHVKGEPPVILSSAVVQEPAGLCPGTHQRDITHE